MCDSELVRFSPPVARLPFEVGQRVRHMHRHSIRGYVVRSDKAKTTIACRMDSSWEDSWAVFYTDQLELIPKKGKRWRAARTRKAKGNEALNTLSMGLRLPAVFVDATMGHYEKSPHIVAVIVGSAGERLYHSIERVNCKNCNQAEYQAIALGVGIRLNERWPVYSDSSGQAAKFPAPNVVWISRGQNRIADALLRVYR